MRKIARTARKAKTVKINAGNNNPDKPKTGKAAQKEKELKFAEQSVNGSTFDIKSKGFKNTNIRVQDINRWLQNPQKNYQNLQNISRWLYSTSGVYASLVDYYATLPKYNWTIMPISSPLLLLEKRSNDDVKKYFYENAMKAQKLKIREACYRFNRDLTLDGEGYYYIIEDAKGVLYQKFPNDYCMLYKNENGVLRFALDMDKVKSDDPLIYPSKIQTVIEEYARNPKSDIFLENYYPIGKEGVCFTTNDSGHGIPVLSKILDAIVNMDSKKTLQDSVDIVNNVKMIHNEIPKDKDGKPIVDVAVAGKYNSAIKENLIDKGIEEGLISITNPLKPTILNLDTGTNKNAITLVKQALEGIYDEMGVSEMLFNSVKGGSEALKKSVIVDSAKVLVETIFQFQNYFTGELASVKGHIKYEVKILESTWFNEQEKIKESKEELAYGGSVKVHYANLGFTPLEMINLIEEENILGIKEKLTPIATSHTQSGKNAGRPNTEEMREEGKEVSDITESKADKGGDLG